MIIITTLFVSLALLSNFFSKLFSTGRRSAWDSFLLKIFLEHEESLCLGSMRTL